SSSIICATAAAPLRWRPTPPAPSPRHQSLRPWPGRNYPKGFAPTTSASATCGAASTFSKTIPGAISSPFGRDCRRRANTDAVAALARALGGSQADLSTCAGLSWPTGIDWQRWVGRDFKVRAVVIAVISIPIESVFTHPKEDLQRAFLAVDVGEANVSLMK